MNKKKLNKILDIIKNYVNDCFDEAVCIQQQNKQINLVWFKGAMFDGLDNYINDLNDKHLL